MEELEWQIAPGFVAVTGETGAGKSIIIGALQLLLGERADKSLIRTGADLCARRVGRRNQPGHATDAGGSFGSDGGELGDD